MKRMSIPLLAALVAISVLLGSSCQPERISPAQVAQQKAAQKKLEEQNKPPAEPTTPAEPKPAQPVETPTPPKPEPLPTLETAVVPVENPPADAPDIYYVKFECSTGEFLIKCTKEWAPIGAQHFYDLVNLGFYNDCRFFRVVAQPKPFVIQFGIAGDPALNEQYGATIPDDPVKTANTPGTLTFAKTDRPNTRSTQIFINLADNSNLDFMGFAPFGQIAEGREAINKIYAGYGERPSQEQQMIQMQGNNFLNQKYPKLSYIKKAYIVTLVETAPEEASTPEPAPEASGSENKEQ